MTSTDVGATNPTVTNSSRSSAHAGPSPAPVTQPHTEAASSESENEDDDDLDIFDTGLSALFSIPPIGFSSSHGKPHVYTPPSHTGLPPLDIYLANPPADIFTQLQAQNLWLAAVYLADKISQHVIWPLGNVVELGAGAGLPSLITGLRRKADKADKKTGDETEGVVLCTDYDDPAVVANIRRNAEANSSPIEVRGHSWGTDVAPLLALAPGGFDSVILADTLWNTETHEILLQSILALLTPGGTVHLAAGLHTGRGPHERFFELAAAKGLQMSKVEEVIYDNGEWKPHEEESAHLEEERGVVIYYTLHRR